MAQGPSNPRVTLAMPVFNGENFVEDALASLVSQSFDDLEVVITDNGSTDRTPEIVASFAERDPRVRYFRNSSNLGAAANYNRGLDLARGEFLKWCAHDDLIDPRHVEKLVTTLDANPSASLVYGRTICIDEDGEEIETVGAEAPELVSDNADERFYSAIVNAGTCFQIFGMYRTADLKKSTKHRPYYGSDRALLAEMALFGKHIRAPEAIFYNREHASRSINIADKVARSQWQNGDASRGAAAEHLNLARHLWEIAGRHGDWRLKTACRAKLLRRFSQPRQIARYALEATTLVTPGPARRIRRVFSGPSNVAEVRGSGRSSKQTNP